MKRKNLFPDQYDTKRIKIFDSKTAKHNIFECYIALANLTNQVPVFVCNSTTRIDNKQYFKNICDKSLVLIKCCSEKIINNNITETYAEKIPFVIDNIKKEYNSMMDIFPVNFVLDKNFSFDILFYLGNCLENCNLSENFVTISKSAGDKSSLFSMVENGSIANHFQLLKIIIEKGVKRNVSHMINLFFRDLIEYVIELSCMFIDILQSSYYFTNSPKVKEIDFTSTCYNLLINNNDNDIIEFTASCLVMRTRDKYYDFIAPDAIIKLLDHESTSVVIASLHILFNVILYGKNDAESINQLLSLLLRNNSVISNIVLQHFIYLVFCSPNLKKKKNINQIYYFMVDNINLLMHDNNIVKNVCRLLGPIFFFYKNEAVMFKSLQIIIDIVIEIIDYGKNVVPLLNMITTLIINNSAMNYTNKICNVIAHLISSNNQVIAKTAAKCFKKICMVSNEFVCTHQGLIMDTIIETLLADQMIDDTQCIITDMWFTIGTLVSQPMTEKIYKTFINQTDVQKQIFDIFGISAIKYCSDEYADFIVKSLSFLGFEDCAINNNIKILIEKLIIIACSKDLSVEKNNFAFEQLKYLNSFLNNHMYCSKIFDVSSLSDSENPIAVTFYVDYYHFRYVKINKFALWDDNNEMTGQSICKCVELMFNGNMEIVTSVKYFLSSFLSDGTDDRIKSNVKYLISLGIIKICKRLIKNKNEAVIQCVCVCIDNLSKNALALVDLSSMHRYVIHFLGHQNEEIVNNSIVFLHNIISKDNIAATLINMIPLFFVDQKNNTLTNVCKYINRAMQFHAVKRTILGSEYLMRQMIKLLSHSDELIVQICCTCLGQTINYDEHYKIFYDDENLSLLTKSFVINPGLISQLVRQIVKKSKIMFTIFSYIDFVRALFNLRDSNHDCGMLWDMAVDDNKLITELKSVIYSSSHISEWEIYAMLCSNGKSLKKKVVAALVRAEVIDQKEFYEFLKIISLGYSNHPTMTIELPTLFYGSDVKNCHEDIYIRREYCDVSFDIDGTIIACHRCILATKSEYFNKLFALSTFEQKITMKETNAQLFEKIIRYIYLQSILFESVEELIEIFYLADRFDLPQLIETCICTFVDILAIGNVEFINSFAEKNEIYDIKVGIYQWLVINYVTLPEKLGPFIDKYWTDVMNHLIMTHKVNK